jgi:hypothetical protein
MVSFLVVSSLGKASCVEFEMPLVNGSTKTAKLPFPYHSITDEERSRLVYVPEVFYTVLEESSPLLGAVIGPCTPCSFVGVHHKQLRKTVLMHAHYELNDAASVLAVVDKEFGQEVKGEDLIVKMFTRGIKHFPQECNITAEEQRIIFTDIFKALHKKYKLTSGQIQAVLFSLPFFLEASSHTGADQSVFVDKNFNLYSVSLVAERIFLKKDIFFSPENLFALCQRSCDRFKEVYKGYLEKYFSDSERRESPIPVLKRLPDSEMGLEKLPE